MTSEWTTEYQTNLKEALSEAIGSLDPARVTKREMEAAQWFLDCIRDQPDHHIKLTRG